MQAKKRNAIMAVLAVVLVAALTVGGTLAYMTDSESLTNVFTVGDLDVTISEPNYPTECDLDDRVPGDSFPKDPTIKEIKGDAYMRVKVEFIDTNTGAPVSAERLALIQKTLYFDPNFSATIAEGGYKGSANLRVFASGSHTPNNTYHYTEADLASKVAAGTIQNWYNQNSFDLGTTSDGGATVYLLYKNSITNDIFKEGATAQVFTSVVFPSNWNQTELQKLGSYSIKFTVEVIQSTGFANRAQAFTALDKEVSDSTALTNYAITSGGV